MSSLYLYGQAGGFMRVAIVGSRSLHIDHLEDYLPDGVTEIISGGAQGADTSARLYAQKHHIPLHEYLPEYKRYGRAAPLQRNLRIVQDSDLILAFWDGQSRGTVHVIQTCRKYCVPHKVYMPASLRRARP